MDLEVHKLDAGLIQLFNKLNDVKMELRGMNIKKTGVNKYKNRIIYRYFELEDFIPPVEVLFKKYGLGSFNVTAEGNFFITVYDKDTNVCFSWATPIKVVESAENGVDTGVHMKAEQSAQTYAKRTLWLQILDILEKNNIELQHTPTNQSKTKNKTSINKETPQQVQQTTETKNKPDGTIQKVKYPTPEALTGEIIDVMQLQGYKDTDKDAFQRILYKETQRNKYPLELKTKTVEFYNKLLEMA